VAFGGTVLKKDVIRFFICNDACFGAAFALDPGSFFFFPLSVDFLIFASSSVSFSVAFLFFAFFLSGVFVCSSFATDGSIFPEVSPSVAFLFFAFCFSLDLVCSSFQADASVFPESRDPSTLSSYVENIKHEMDLLERRCERSAFMSLRQKLL
jgi:hypothetical protein